MGRVEGKIKFVDKFKVSELEKLTGLTPRIAGIGKLLYGEQWSKYSHAGIKNKSGEVEFKITGEQETSIISKFKIQSPIFFSHFLT